MSNGVRVWVPLKLSPHRPPLFLAERSSCTQGSASVGSSPLSPQLSGNEPSQSGRLSFLPTTGCFSMAVNSLRPHSLKESVSNHPLTSLFFSTQRVPRPPNPSPSSAPTSSLPRLSVKFDEASLVVPPVAHPNKAEKPQMTT